MKYFTKEELVDITKELLENPTRETLKNLNNKYNGKKALNPKGSRLSLRRFTARRVKTQA